MVRGDLVLKDRIVENGAVAIEGERIAAVFEHADAADAEQILDFSGRYVVPGLVDTHVHTGSMVTEGIARATAAAAAGGVTTVVDMPYDTPQPTTDIAILRDKVAHVQAEALVDVGLYGTMKKTGGHGALDPLLEEGVCAFKFSTFESDPNRFPRIADGDLLDAFEQLADSQVPIVLHAENEEIITSRLAKARAAGETDNAAHGRSRPVVSETAAVAVALELAHWSGARLHVAHVTHPHGFELIDSYRQRGAHVSGETCVHYLALTDEDDVEKLGPLAKVNPAIRDARAREGLWRSLLAGRIATVSTDHAPWPLERKQPPMLDAASGIPGLETFLPVLWTEAVRRGADLPFVLGYVTWRPAEVFGLAHRKGSLEPGKDADLAVFDARSPWRFDASKSHSSAKWSPFDGREFVGRVEAAFLRGRQVARGGEVLVDRGYGTWLRRGG